MSTQNIPTTSQKEDKQSSSNTSKPYKSKYKMGEWDNMEEVMMLEALRHLREQQEAARRNQQK